MCITHRVHMHGVYWPLRTLSMYAACSLSLPPGQGTMCMHLCTHMCMCISRHHLTTKRNTHYGSAYYMALLIMAARYHLIKITKRNIADFDFRLKVCTTSYIYAYA